MSDKFSGAVRLADLNDFIAPSQACVVNLKGQKKVEASNLLTDEVYGVGEVQLQSKKLRGFSQARAVPDEAVKVTLHDCLACSGCITSAETIMLEQQSTGEFLAQLQSPDKAVVVSVSPQSRASLAALYGVTPRQAFQKLTKFLKSLGVRAVFDTSCSRDVALLEACEEFVARYREAQGFETITPEGTGKETTASTSLPMLASACPGWVCYAEKTHGTYVLPHISSTKSPQQVMGSIIKRHTYKELNLRPEEIYHVTVMPCYDKKLEASRDDFIFSVERGDESYEGLREGATGDDVAGSSARVTEVDCVLTSSEVLELLQSKDTDFNALEEAPLDRLLSNVGDEGHLYGTRGGSGGYAEYIFKYAAQVLFAQTLSGPLEFITLRNADFKEITLEVNGKKVLRFACAYGFRNIQNLVRKIKTGKSEYDFVEIMACPGGCLNGGGQIKPRKGQSLKSQLQDLETVYLQEVDVRDPVKNPVAIALYSTWLGHPFSETAKQVLHTGYHHREKTIGSLFSNW